MTKIYWDGAKQVERDLTPEELSQNVTDEENQIAAKPMKEWLAQMNSTDGLSRVLEDVIDVLTVDQINALAPETKAKYNNKKTIRSQKPI